MKKKFTNILLAAAVLLLSFAGLTGCAKFDKTAYVQAAFDSIYKGEHTKFSEITKTEASVLENNYLNAIEAESVSFMNYMGIGDYLDYVNQDVRTKIRHLLQQIYKHTSYSVGPENEDGTVPVKILPVSLYSLSGKTITDYMQEFFDKNDKKEFKDLTDEEFYSRYIDGIINIMAESMDAITYTNEITVNVTVNFDDNGVYSISEDSFAEIDKYILDYTI